MPDPELIEIATVEYVPPPIIEVTCNDGPMLLAIRQRLDGYNDTSAANAAAALASEMAAKASELAAAASEAAAAADEAAAAASAAAALASQNAAATSETNAATSETDAATSASNAATSETNAAASEAKAEDWAIEAEDVEVETGQYSAFHWAQKAAANGVSLSDNNVWTGSNDFEGAFSWQTDSDNTFVEFDIDHVTAGNSMPTFGIDWKRSGNRWWRLATNVDWSYNWAIQQYDRTDDSYMATRFEIGDQSNGPIRFRDAADTTHMSVIGGSATDKGVVMHTEMYNASVDPLLVNKHRLVAYGGILGRTTPGTPVLVNDYGMTSISYVSGPYYTIKLDEACGVNQHMQFACEINDGSGPCIQWCFEIATDEVAVVVSDHAGSWKDFDGTIMVWFVENP